MKTKLIATFFLLLPIFTLLGQKYSTKTATVKFEASVPSFEEVVGTNKSTSAVLESDNGNLAVLALVKGFRFKIALMEEHFNENYAESDKYPKATFSGKITGFNVSDLTSEPKKYSITGDLTFHGKTKKVTSTALISKTGNVITISGNFTVKPEEFGIDIPGTVSKKVAKTIEVSYTLPLTK